MLVWPSCRRSESQPAPPASASAASDNQAASGDEEPPISLSETVDRLRDYHRRRLYARLEEYIAPDVRVPFMNTLMAMDRFLAANNELAAALARQMDPALLPQWDLSAWADAMGVFAPQVRVLSAREDGRTGQVSFQVRGRVPLQSADFRWVNDRWFYDPGADIPGLASAIHDLAAAVGTIAREVPNKQLSPEALDTQFRLRIVPRLNAILALRPAVSSTAGGDGG